MASLKNTMYVTGNSIKVADMKNVLGENISLFKTNIDEIQGMPLEVSKDKIRKIYLKKEGNVVACEDTSFGFGKLATVVKDFVDTCDEYDGDLYNVMKAIAPKETIVEYTSIVSFKNSEYEAMFECVMRCKLCPRTGKGGIDPFAIPLEYRVVQYINGEREIIVENQMIHNPKELSIAQQLDFRHLVHPRYYSLRAYKQWLSTHIL